ncbi:pleiotropic drug resistance protein 3-like isoform X1 [Primulina huaijiensis]|uniref:pleiotropic drug resistance protein 3-like isoform X1 n=1 Tax=Primulina huaijiensis TaxID=1492673 RepID=UPI003CC75273
MESFRRDSSDAPFQPLDSSRKEDEEFELQWAAIERLPTFQRLRTSVFDISQETTKTDAEIEGKRIVNVAKLGALERRLFVQKLIKNVEKDNLRLLKRIRERIDRVDVKLPAIEVRFRHLSVEAKCRVVDGKPLPTLWNSLASMLPVWKAFGCQSQEARISILKGISGIIKPSRLTLILGPPGCGKTTLLKALAGKLQDPLKLQVTGEVSYNGYELREFVPEKTSAYISQYDIHVPEMTVKETIDFSARCQGVGSRGDIMQELSKREKAAGIIPDPDIDTYMKAISIEGQRRNLQTDYVLKILGMDMCSDVIAGDAIQRGISGGQKKRLTTGEIIVGPMKALFMDEISTGLDSSTTFQIVTCLQQLAHLTDATILIVLLQPDPETFELFDDVLLMAEGRLIYQGPRSEVLQFFENCGFKCPDRKSAADFLQEVISRKDQSRYWCRSYDTYSYISVSQFCELFETSYLGERLNQELSKQYDKSQSHENALSFSTCTISKWELFKACMAREVLLMKRNIPLYVFKTVQLIIIAFITMTIFMSTRMIIDLKHANYVMGSLFYTLIRLMTNGVAELAMTVSRLPVFYKQKAFCLYPVWAYSIPASVIKIPLSLLDSIIWTSMTYYVIGYSPEVERFFCQILLLFLVHGTSTSLCRLIASIFKSMVVATTFGLLTLVVMFLFGGFIIQRSSLPPWLRWGFWVSPMTYGEIGISLNEFLAPRWQKVSLGNTTLGQTILAGHGMDFGGYFYWISVGVLFGFMIMFDIGFVLALTYLKAPGAVQAIISKDKLLHLKARENHKSFLENDSTEASYPSDSSKIQGSVNHKTNTNRMDISVQEMADQVSTIKGNMILPFQPLTMVFQGVQYFVDTPKEMRESGFDHRKLQLLHDMTGAFRPGILTALMGVSGAGKTTLMDVLSGRKNGGTVEGDKRIAGYPKVQKTFARISGYCEQYDIHSPQITVEESVMYSAWLRLPTQIDPESKHEFVKEVISMIELDEIKDFIVGIPGQNGLSTEQRKRLTIAVELVSNPSIIFMDEPTSGLDARAAAIVMRTVKKIVATGRTTVCTIHQPSIDVFEVFDELILMKMGGKIIYSGELGYHSHKLIEYFERIPQLQKIRNNYNPATWMLEVTSTSVEEELGLDFAKIYKESTLYQETMNTVRQLSEPQTGSKDLHFPTQYPQNGWEHFKACLWKQCLSYWRSPEYNLARFLFMIVAALFFGAIFWQKGQDINNEQDFLNILGSMYLAVIFLGINNCSLVLPYVATERTVFYRERFAGMYSSMAYSLAQVTIELPYVFMLAALYVTIIYPSVGYYASVSKVLWCFYTTFCTFLYFIYLGMLIISLTPSLQVASVMATAVYTIWSLFSGFLLPGPEIPIWWSWCYWISPSSWSLNGLLTSQYGDLDVDIVMFGEVKSAKTFLKEYFGFRHDRLWIVAVALLGFPALFASLFAFFMGRLNFQRR